MLKQKLLKLLLNTFPVLSLLILAKPASAFDPIGGAVDAATENIMESLGGALTSAIASLFAWLANIISTLLFDKLLSPILNIVKEDSNILLNHEIAQNVWTGSLAVANGLFLLALVLASVAIILRLNTGMYNLKKVLGGFIAAVILSNLSLLIVRVLVELGDNLNIAAYGLFTSIDSRLTYDIISGPDGFITALTKIKAPIGADGVGGDAHIGAVLLAIIIMVLVFWILLKLTLILIERMFWIFLMAIFAPIIFALSLLPTTQKLAADWWNKLIKWILVLPLVSAILSIAVYFLILTVEEDPSGAINPAKFVSQLTEPTFFAELISGGKGIFLIAGLFILYQAGRANNLLGISGGGLSGAVDTPKAMKGTVGAVKGTVGAVTKPVADTVTGKNKLGKFGKTTKEGAARMIGSGAWGKGLQKAAVKGASWKKRQTGPLGLLINQAGRKEALDARIKKNESEELINQNAGHLNHTHKKLNTATQNRYGKSWDDMTLDEQKIAKAQNPKIKKLASKSKDLRAELMWRSREFAHQIKREDLDSPEEYDKILKDPKSTAGERVIAAIQLKRIGSNRNNIGFDEAKKSLDDSENIAKLKSDGLDISSLSIGKKKKGGSAQEAKSSGTTSAATISMVSHMQAGQKLKKLQKMLNNLGSLDFEALQMAQDYHKSIQDDPSKQVEAETALRNRLSSLGVRDKKRQDIIINTAKVPVVKKMLANSRKAKPVDDRNATTNIELNATIETLSGAQEAANVSAKVQATNRRTISNAQKIIVEQVNNGIISQNDVTTINSATQSALNEISQVVENNPDVPSTNKLSSLNLEETVLEQIQNSFNTSGLVTGQGLDEISQINDATIDTVLGHLNTVNQATAKRNPIS